MLFMVFQPLAGLLLGYAGRLQGGTGCAPKFGLLFDAAAVGVNQIGFGVIKGSGGWQSV